MLFKSITDASQTKTLFEDLFSEAANEVLAFSRPPYCWNAGEVNPAVLDALARGVKIRAVYPASLEEDTDEQARRAEFAAYARAGVEARVLNDVPIKLVVFDRKVSLLAMPNGTAQAGYPPNFLVEDGGFSGIQADAFDHLWARADTFTSETRADAFTPENHTRSQQ